MVGVGPSSASRLRRAMERSDIRERSLFGVRAKRLVCTRRRGAPQRMPRDRRRSLCTVSIGNVVRSALAIVVSLGATLVLGCRGDGDRVKPAPEGDARVIDAPPAPSAPSCLRQETCGRWMGCVLARPQPLPFVANPGEAPITSGSWYRFDWQDRPNQVGHRQRLCVGDAGRCFEGLQHQIACLPVFNLVEPDYRCETIAGECRKMPMSSTDE